MSNEFLKLQKLYKYVMMKTSKKKDCTKYGKLEYYQTCFSGNVFKAVFVRPCF